MSLDLLEKISHFGCMGVAYVVVMKRGIEVVEGRVSKARVIYSISCDLSMTGRYEYEGWLRICSMNSTCSSNALND